MTRHGATARHAFTLVESLVATTILVLVFFAAYGVIRSVTRPATRGELTLDQIQQMTKGVGVIEREIREARQIIHPPAGAPPARMLFLRDFEGRIVVYYFSPERRELRRAVLNLQGAPTEDALPAARNLDGAYFAVNAVGLVSWGLFVAESAILGSAGRRNQ